MWDGGIHDFQKSVFRDPDKGQLKQEARGVHVVQLRKTLGE